MTRTSPRSDPLGSATARETILSAGAAWPCRCAAGRLVGQEEAGRQSSGAQPLMRLAIDPRRRDPRRPVCGDCGRETGMST